MDDQNVQDEDEDAKKLHKEDSELTGDEITGAPEATENTSGMEFDNEASNPPPTP